MMLCLDCGNTRLKWGLLEHGKWIAGGAVLHAEMAQLAGQLPPDCQPDTVIGCNVAGAEVAAQIDAQVEAALSLPVRWITASARQCGVDNGYENPSSLGADRWAALVGAHSLHQGAALVVLAGTATTIDVLAADGRHQGGLILPGITMMTNSLAQGTARLPLVALVAPLPLATGEYKAIPRNTHDAIVSGAVQATLGAIERMFATLPGQQNLLCLLSGGAADSLQPALDLPLRRVDNLVLAGLACIAAELGLHPA